MYAFQESGQLINMFCEMLLHILKIAIIQKCKIYIF